jgi:hypothetical protein
VKSAAAILVLFSVFLLVGSVVPMHAQAASATVSGAIQSNSGVAIPNAKVTVKNLATGQTQEAQTAADGRYQIENLSPGEYELSVSAVGFDTKTEKVSLTAGATQKLTLALTALANAPSQPSLSDLGFPNSETQSNPELQARLNKRSHMLKTHQKLGLITTAPMLATIITGFGAGGKQTSSSSRDLHVALGSTTAVMYFTTAYFAIAAPKVPGTETRGQIRWHKALAWVHGPGMILTPILGAMAFDQKSKGEKIHGAASFHGPVAIITGAAYGAALLSVSVKF